MKKIYTQSYRQKSIRKILLITLILTAVSIYGTIGFILVEGVSFSDAFYMTFITMTTVGYAEVFELSNMGRMFTISVIIFGMTGSGISIALLTNLVFENTVLNLFKGKKMTMRLEMMKDHYIVCGYGTTGSSIVDELLFQGHDVVVIDCNDIETVLPSACLFLQGDARRDELLKEAGIERAKGLAATLSEDPDNVFVTLSARSLNDSCRIVSRYKDDDTEKKLVIAGADQAISPYRMGGQRMALGLTNPAFQQLLDATFSGSNLSIHFSHIPIPENSVLHKTKLKDSEFRKHSLGALIVAVVERNGNTIFNPPPDLSLQNIVELLVLGDDQQIKAIEGYLDVK